MITMALVDTGLLGKLRYRGDDWRTAVRAYRFNHFCLRSEERFMDTQNTATFVSFPHR